MAIPAITGMVSNPAAGTLPLTLFCGSTFAMVTFYGGLMSVAPAYVGDLFGAKHQSPIFGRLLTAWSSAAICGPILLTTLRSRSYDASARELAAQIDPATFESTFGAPVENLTTLLDSKTVTINGLLAALPPGTPDPTPSLYNDSMYTMAGAMAVAVAANSLIRPLNR